MHTAKNKSSGYLPIKKRLDVLIGISVSLFLTPVYLLIGLAIVIEDGFPVLFKQKRVGQDQSYFYIYKFRTMKRNTPHDCPTHLLKDPDQYLTSVGKFLRQYSLDELPQFFNMAKGEMSLVGPRPALWNQFDLIQERENYGANAIRPGLTGWAQIHGRDTLEIKDKAAYDGYYVKHLSLLLDLRCIFGTVMAVAERKGFLEGGTGQLNKVKANQKKMIICTNHSYMFYQFHKELIMQLSESWQVILVSPFTGHIEELKQTGIGCREIHIDRRSCNPLKDFGLLIYYIRLYHREKPDLVITYSIKPNIYAGIACQILKISYCANIQGLGTAFQKPLLAKLVTCLYRFALLKASVVFFENKANARLFLQKHIISKEQVKVLRGAGVNLEQYTYSHCHRNRETIRFLYLGRLMKEKGIDELFDAFCRLHAKYGSRVILDIVGFYEEQYRSKIRKLCQAGIAVFHGFQKNPVPFYKNADCIVLPSYHEGMSNVLLEAAANGRPVITSDIPGCREAVRDQISGYICPPKNRQALYEKMENFVQLDENARIQMGLAGRKHMEKYFNRKQVIEETIRSLPSVKGK